MEQCPVEGCTRPAKHRGRHNKKGAVGSTPKAAGGGSSVKKRSRKRRPDVPVKTAKPGVLELADILAERAEQLLTGDTTNEGHAMWRLGAALADYKDARR